MLPFPLFLALRYLRPTRTFLSVVTVISILGVLLGVAILVIVLSVMTGFDNMWRDRILSFKPHLTVVARLDTIQDEDALCDRIEAVPGVTATAASVETRTLAQARGRTVAPILVGLSPDRAARLSRIPEHIPPPGRFDIEDNRCVIGVDMARQLGIDVGARLLVYSPLNVMRRDEIYLPEDLEVAGVFDMGMRDYDAGFVITSLDVARKLVGLDRGAYAIHVMTTDAFRFGEFAALVADAIGPAFDVRTWKEVDSMLFAALSHEKTMMFILLVFITIVAIFCVTNTLIVITVRKTHEIGLLKALGFPSRSIMAAFVWLGWIQCLIGTAAGIAIGLLVLNNLERIVACLTAFDVSVFPKEIYGLDGIPWDTSVTELARIALFVMTFCTLSSLLPAYRAARLDPVQALRGE